MASVADLVQELKLKALVSDDAELARGRALADGGDVRLGRSARSPSRLKSAMT